MRHPFAGVYDASGAGGAQAVARALEGAGPLRVETSGPLAVAAPALAAGPVLCLLAGRITNAEALGRSLDLPGADAPTLLSTGYRRFGDDLVERLRGEFTVLLWDGQARTGILARDRLGAAPLFLCEQAGRLCFASEIRVLLRLLPRRPAPDRAAVVHWLVGGSLRGGRTLYDGVSTLEPGHYMRLAHGRCERRRFWAPSYAGTSDLPRDELAGRLREEVAASVRRSAGDGERAGILLSGGLDSASVAGVATRDRERGGPSPSAYSAVFPRHPSTDESELIDRITSDLRLPGVRIEVTGGSMVAGALEYVREWELPLMDQNNFFAQPLLRQAAANGVKAMLDGEGGDELFGAARGLIADRVRQGRMLAAVRQTARLPGAGAHPPLRPLARLVLRNGVRGALPYRLHQALRRARPATGSCPSWFRPDSARVLVDTDDSLAWKRMSGPRWWAQLADSLTNGVAARGVHDHARRRAATAGLDARHPLLDAELLEFVLRLPPELSFDPHRGRPMLRASMAGLVPDEVRLRPGKSYFDAPFYEAMAGHDRDAVRRILLHPGAEIGAFVDPGVVRRDLLDVAPREHPLGLRHWTASTWRLVTAEIWLRSQGGPAFAEQALASWELAKPRYVLSEVLRT